MYNWRVCWQSRSVKTMLQLSKTTPNGSSQKATFSWTHYQTKNAQTRLSHTNCFAPCKSILQVLALSQDASTTRTQLVCEKGRKKLMTRTAARAQERNRLVALIGSQSDNVEHILSFRRLWIFLRILWAPQLLNKHGTSNTPTQRPMAYEKVRKQYNMRDSHSEKSAKCTHSGSTYTKSSLYGHNTIPLYMFRLSTSLRLFASVLDPTFCSRKTRLQK